MHDVFTHVKCTFAELWNHIPICKHQHREEMDYFPHSGDPADGFAVNAPHHAWPQETTDPLAVCIVLSFLEIHIKGTMDYVVFCVFFILLSIMF